MAAGLRQRRGAGGASADDALPTVDRAAPPVGAPASTPRPEPVLGRTPDGTVFEIPVTHDVLTGLFDPREPKSQIDVIILASLAAQILLFACLPIKTSRYVFMALFGLWRLSYDLGLGVLLDRQSKRQWIARMIKREGWMDSKRRPKLAAWIRRQLEAKFEPGRFDFEATPLEYSSWLLFRHLADIILLNDFLAYSLFAVAWLQWPPGHSIWLHAVRWVAGWTLILFRRRFWGDVWFARQAEMTFDGVFSLAPHPMYSVGYAGYYGLSLIVASHTVLVVSMLAHACQFAFLVFFENPHIERTYGKKEPLVQRARMAAAELHPSPGVATSTRSSSTSTDSISNEDHDAAIETDVEPATAHASHAESAHDMHHRYFGRDVIGLLNLDLFRARDLVFVVACTYATLAVAFPVTTPKYQIAFAFVNALAWRVFHSLVLGCILRWQSDSKWFVRHFIKHTAYDSNDGPVRSAFDSFKFLYNASSVMVHTSFAALAWRCFLRSDSWSLGNEILRYVFGLTLIGLQVWAAISTFEVLGEAGWFYADFFIEDYPRALLYTGIYRFLNNPERSMGGAAFFGMAVLSGSKLVTVMAIISVLSHWLFLSYVETPHMRKLYGDLMRADAGVTRTLKDVAERNVPSEVRKVVREVQGTLDKVRDEAADAVLDFVRSAAPRLSEYARETKVLLQQSRERLVITRIRSNLDGFDARHYSLRLVSPQTDEATDLPDLPAHRAPLRVHFGESITLAWRAPSHHSRRDWIGIYRVGANSSREITSVSSQKRWRGVVNEWDGDVFTASSAPSSASKSAFDAGEVVFMAAVLPPRVGAFEFRYHHDGGHNALALVGPVEIFVERPADPTSFASVRATLLRLVCSCLGHDAALVPRSATTGNADDDDFSILDVEQAERLAYAISESCGVELAREVVIADANVSRLARRVVEGRRILRPWQPSAAGETVH